MGAGGSSSRIQGSPPELQRLLHVFHEAHRQPHPRLHSMLDIILGDGERHQPKVTSPPSSSMHCLRRQAARAIAASPKSSRHDRRTFMAIGRSYAAENSFSRDQGFHSAHSPGMVSESLISSPCAFPTEGDTQTTCYRYQVRS